MCVWVCTCTRIFNLSDIKLSQAAASSALHNITRKTDAHAPCVCHQCDAGIVKYCGPRVQTSYAGFLSYAMAKFLFLAGNLAAPQ